MRFAVAILCAMVLLTAVVEGTSPSTARADAHGYSCRVDAPKTDFGQADYHNENTATIAISVTCPVGLRYSIALLETPQCGSLRGMTEGDAYIGYVILTPDRMGVWCDGTNGTAVVTSIGTGSPQYFIGFAKIAAGSPQSRIPDGRYDDTIDILIGDQQ